MIVCKYYKNKPHSITILLKYATCKTRLKHYLDSSWFTVAVTKVWTLMQRCLVRDSAHLSNAISRSPKNLTQDTVLPSFMPSNAALGVSKRYCGHTEMEDSLIHACQTPRGPVRGVDLQY